MKRKIFDGTEMVEVEVPDRVAGRRFRLEDVCPEDSECLRARLEYLGVEPGAWSKERGAGSREIEAARRVTVRRSAQGQFQFASMRRVI